MRVADDAGYASCALLYANIRMHRQDQQSGRNQMLQEHVAAARTATECPGHV
jgi:hypothetical protein